MRPVPVLVNKAIDVESLASSLEKKVMGNPLGLSPECCIFRTPTILSRHKPLAYVPNLFSFGPFHHSHQNLQASEGIKLKYLRELLDRNPHGMLNECFNSINEVKSKARACYAENLDHVPDKEFVEMLVVDGCFIVELLRKDREVVPKTKDDPVFSMSCILQFLHHDLILLENQIPWLVLELLFEKTKSPIDSGTESLVELALYFFQTQFSYDNYENPKNPNGFLLQKPNHILDLLRMSLLLRSHNYESKQQDSEWEPIPSVTRLTEAGVNFVRAPKDVESILDIRFQNGAIEIPSLTIQETTETIFRNLISYEQCLPNCKPVFTSYAKIMDNLIDKQHDMEILVKKDVLDNWLSPEDATEFFNKLYHDTYLKEFYYGQLCIDVNRHCQNWWPKWRAAFVQNYFFEPWAIVAIIYAFLMFILTLLQVVLK